VLTMWDLEAPRSNRFDFGTENGGGGRSGGTPSVQISATFQPTRSLHTTILKHQVWRGTPLNPIRSCGVGKQTHDFHQGRKGYKYLNTHKTDLLVTHWFSLDVCNVAQGKYSRLFSLKQDFIPKTGIYSALL